VKIDAARKQVTITKWSPVEHGELSVWRPNELYVWLAYDNQRGDTLQQCADLVPAKQTQITINLPPIPHGMTRFLGVFLRLSECHAIGETAYESPIVAI
jgi:hypothetical protein